MTEQHRAKPEHWLILGRQAETLGCASSNAILELRSRIEGLEAAQLEQAESHRFCTDAIVRRVEALEARDKEDASCWAMVRSGMHALRERVEALEAAPQDKLDRLIALDRDDPTPDAPMTELRAASAEARPAGLVERVADLLGHHGDGTARAAIREVAAAVWDRWVEEESTGEEIAQWLEQEADRG